MLVPIGSWCRTSYQVREFLKYSNAQRLSYPYDWTITPFLALKHTLHKDFQAKNALRADDLTLSIFGSIEDKSTQLIHHHDFLTEKISELSRSGNINENGVPLELFNTDLLVNAQGRFQYTYKNLEDLKKYEQKIGFVRWIRAGHPDRKLPNAFAGENLDSLGEILADFLGHNNFSILLVKTKKVSGELAEEDMIESYRRGKYGVAATIKERQRFAKFFMGDTEPWHKLLSQFVEEEKIVLPKKSLFSFLNFAQKKWKYNYKNLNNHKR